MAGGDLTTKVRLVRCPRCTLVLPELPDFNVYKCGGCGTTLVAKHRANVARSVDGDPSNEEAVRENHADTDHVAEEKVLGSSNKEVLPFSGECSLWHNDESDQSKSGDQPGDVNLTTEAQTNGNRGSGSDVSDFYNEGSEVSNDVFSPTAFSDDKSDEFVPNGNVELADRNGNDEEERSDDKNESSDDPGNEDSSSSDFDEFARNERELVRDDNKDITQGFDQTETPELVRTENESLSSSLAVARADREPAIDDIESSLDNNANIEDTDNKKSDSDSKVKSPNNVATSITNSSSHVPLRESFMSPRSALKHPQYVAHPGYGHLRSVEFNPSSEPRGNLGEAYSKSPIRSSHAHNGSVFSHDGRNDQSHSFEERTRRENFMAQAMMNRDSDEPGRHPWLDKNNLSPRNGMWDRDEFVEPSRQDRATRNWRPERQRDHQSSSAFRQQGYENGGPSNHSREQFYRNSSFERQLIEDPEQMVNLLRMVLEIQNQTRKSGSLYDAGNEPTPGPSQKPMMYDSPRFRDFEAPRDRHFRYQNDPRYLGRYASGSDFPHRGRAKKIPFSGDPTISNSHQLNPTFSPCIPQQWSRSAQLPPPSLYNSASGLCRVHPGQSYCNCYTAFPPSPQWSIDSEYPPWGGRETTYHHPDQPRRSQELSRPPRVAAAKRHFRPVAHGAPFVVCYKCCNVLQLPADFLLFKKKCHRLRCGACSHVLKFSLETTSHIVRYRPEVAKTADPPPLSVVEDNQHRDANGRNEAPSAAQTPRGVDHTPRHVDNGFSAQQRESFSSEADADSSAPVQTPLGRAFDRIIFGVLNPPEDSGAESVPETPRGKLKGRPPRHESARPSTSSPRPAADEDQRSTSPLHRLMGYASPSQVIRGSRPYYL